MNLAASMPSNLIAPSGNPLQGGERRYVQSLSLFANGSGSGAYTTREAEFEIWIPSTRLLTIANIGFLPDTAEDAVIPAGWIAIMDVWAKTDTHGFGQGRRFRGNSIVPGPGPVLRPTQLPWSWEAQTGADQWRGKATVPAGGTGLAVSGYLVISVSWEPGAGESAMPTEELRRIFQSCKLVAGAGAGALVFNSTIG